MHTVTSFHASAVPTEQLNAITTDFVALEYARVMRHLLVVRCGLVALVIAVAGFGLGWLPPVASVFGVGLFMAAPGVVWAVELRRSHQLARRLEGVSGRTEHVLRPPSA